MHFILEKPGFDQLITALYLKRDQYITSDAVFGVKSSLIVDPTPVDGSTAVKYGIEGNDYQMITYDFVLLSDREARDLKEQQSLDAMKKLGFKARLVDSLPVPDLD